LQARYARVQFTRGRGFAPSARVHGSAAEPRCRRNVKWKGPATGAAKDSTMARRRRKRGPKWRSPRIWIALVAVLIVGVLYYKPARTYLHTRHTLSQRAAEVQKLRGQHAKLRRLVAASTSDAELAREARRLGLVKPGEQLFIVRGIKRWLKSHASVAGDG
jgi:cell division protein FtsB